MKHALAPEPLAILAQLARANVLLAFDYDGTLAPIMAERDGVQMRPETAALFVRVCTLYPCAVISGRGRSDVSSRLGSAPVKHVIGNHGIEAGPERGLSLVPAIARARDLLDTALASEQGVAVEDKRFSLSLHYRNAPDTIRARDAILHAVQALPDGLCAVPGHMVINIVPENSPTKGDALMDLSACEDAGHALFVGDDVTDEDAFRADSSERLFSVRVGRSPTSAARYFLHAQREVDDLLAWLIAFRRAAHAP